MSNQFERIAIFLSIVTEKITKASSSEKIKLTWLEPDLDISMDSQPATNNEETQVLASGTGGALDPPALFWIANNDISASESQVAYCNAVGIGTYKELHDHVNKFEVRLITSMGKPKNDEHSTLRVLARGMMNSVGTRPELTKSRNARVLSKKIIPFSGKLTVLKNTTNFTIQPTPAEIKSGGNNGAFQQAPFYFIHDEYDGNVGDNSDKLHAEQRLLAAFSKIKENEGMTIGLYGCKVACSCCSVVINSARDSLRDKKNITLLFPNSDANTIRTNAGFDKREVGKTIRALSKDYYP